MQNLLGEYVYQLIILKIKKEEINEIRIRINRKILIKSIKYEFFIEYIATSEYINEVISRATNFSRYAYEEEISNGYVDYLGGIRIGITGRGALNSKNLIAYSSINALCIRIPHVINSYSDIDSIIDTFDNTLIISPPYCGKTTLLRYIANHLSNKYDVTIIDERCEIAGKNIELFAGNKADIVQGIPKNLVFEKIIRCMSPEIIVCDELSIENDINIVEKITRSGVKCLATIHAQNFETLDYKIKNIFNIFITLASKPKIGSIVSIVRRNA